jgi:WW domain-binding protein 2
MTDQYLQEQHAYTITQTIQAEREAAALANAESDRSTSWVMLSQNGDIVRLPHEHIRHNAGSRISMDLSVPRPLQTATPFLIKSENGTAYITNQRVWHSQLTSCGFHAYLKRNIVLTEMYFLGNLHTRKTYG